MSARQFSAEVRRTLVFRLALVAVVLSMLFGVVAFLNKKRQMEESIVGLVAEEALFFDIKARAGVDRAAAVDHEALAREFRSFLEVEPEHRMGRIVFARLRDIDGRLLVTFPEQGGTIGAAVDHLSKEIKGPKDPASRIWHRAARIEGVPHLLLGGAMRRDSGEVIANVEAAFRLSDEAVASIRSGIWLSVLSVVFITATTAACIYPIVMRLTRKLIVLSGNLLRANMDTAEVLGSAIAKRDSDTSEHNYRVTIIAVRIAEALGLDNDAIRNLMKGAFLHDVGKIAISDNILLKQGRLTDEEFEIMKTHVQAGSDIVERSSWLEEGADVVRCHHEKFGGAGYPKGLAGTDIPVSARIFAIADVFDALTSQRPYKEPFSFDRAMAMLEEGRGTHFDPELLDVFAPIAPKLYRELIEQPVQDPQLLLLRIVQRYYGEAVEELRV
jgi:putative nucleotidyltransferase with HDIG domain